MHETGLFNIFRILKVYPGHKMPNILRFTIFGKCFDFCYEKPLLTEEEKLTEKKRVSKYLKLDELASVCEERNLDIDLVLDTMIDVVKDLYKVQ